MAKANPNSSEEELSINEVANTILEPNISDNLEKELQIDNDAVLGLYDGSSEYMNGADIYVLGLADDYSPEELEEFGELARDTDIIVPRPMYQDLVHNKLYELDFDAEDITESGWGKVNGENAKYFRISIN